MRILLWHGYLLGGTGSNVYTRQLARAWMQAGHDVTVFSQEPHPAAYDLGGARVVRPDVGGLLPVFVLDRYEGYEVKLVGDCSADELGRWVEANAAAVREHLPADIVFCNHVLLGGPVGAATGAPFAVKAHGSELEYAMRGNPGLAAWGRDSLRAARAVFVGSAHIRRVLEDVCGHVDRVHEVPPGVDIDDWVPQERSAALAALLAEARRDPPNPGNAEERLPDDGNAGRLERFLAGDRPTVVYFGKLMRNKGVHVLLEALRGVDARAVIVGFGEDRAELERLAGGDVLFTGSAGAPAPRPSARPRGRVRRAVDLPRGVRHGRRRGRRGRVSADRGPPLGARGDRRRAGGGLSAGPAPPRGVRDGRRGRPSREADRAAGAASGGPGRDPRGGPAGHGGAVELDERRRPAPGAAQGLTFGAVAAHHASSARVAASAVPRTGIPAAPSRSTNGP